MHVQGNDMPLEYQSISIKSKVDRLFGLINLQSSQRSMGFFELVNQFHSSQRSIGFLGLSINFSQTWGATNVHYASGTSFN
jgi:hypothetical protein